MHRMNDILSLVQLCLMALAGVSALIESYKKKTLSDAEKDLLIAAVPDGEFYKIPVNEIPGSWIRAGGKDFLDTHDPAYAARYLEAFGNLCKRGFVVHESGVLFVLTSAGFKKAKELAARNRTRRGRMT